VSFGFFTRPVINQSVDGNTQWVVGSFTDTIGQVFPVTVPLDEFDGFFTTLVCKDDVARFNLPIYPMEPEEVPGPPPAGEGQGARNQNADPVEGSMEWLNWPDADGENDDGNPVIVVLPQFLPVGPGQTFPHHHPLVSTTSFRDRFPLLEIWCRGVVYARDHYDGQSVTLGRPLFLNKGLELDNNDPDPTEEFDIRPGLFLTPTQLGPNDACFSEVAGTLGPWSNQVWIGLGGRLELEVPVAPPPAGDAFTPNMFKRALEPLINCDKEFRLAPRTVAPFHLLLGGPPPAGADATDLALLPPLKEDFLDWRPLTN